MIAATCHARETPNRKGKGFAPQTQHLFTPMTAEENLEMGTLIRSDDIKPTMGRIHDLFPIPRERAAQPAGELSRGQRQRVALRRLLRTLPKGAAFRALFRAAALVLSGTAAAAEPWSCDITVECYAGLSCTSVARLLEIIVADHEGQLFLTSNTETLALTRLTANAYAGAHMLITIEPDGATQISVQDDAIILSFGHCRAL